MKKVFALLTVLAVVVCASFAFAADAKPAEEGPKYGTKIGDISEPVSLKKIDGEGAINTGKLAKPTVFLLVSSVCTACTAELTDFYTNKGKIGDKDIAVVVIDIDPAKAAGPMAKYKFPLFTDPDWKFGNAVGLASAPSSLVLGTDGKILYRTNGYKGGQWKEVADIK